MASTFLSTTLGTPTSSRIWTFSTWLKRSGLSSTQHIFSIDSGSNRDAFSFDSDDGLRLYFNGSATGYADLSTNRVLRDTSAFYHLVIAVDTTQATAANRVKLYINGTQYTWDETTVYGDQNYDTFNASGNTFRIGRDRTAANYFDGILTHTHFIDGTQYAASTFGETDSTSGIWKPKTAPSVTYGNNGFFLKFENSGAMGTDSSGNSNTFTVSGNLTQNVDTPSNNFATLNPLDNPYVGQKATFSNGNLTGAGTETGFLAGASNIGVSSGKYYAEFKLTAGTSSLQAMGVIKSPVGNIGTTAPHDSTLFYGVRGNGTKYEASSGTNSWTSTWTTNDIISLALDCDNNRLYIAKNGQYADGSGNYDEAFTGSPAYITLASNETYHFMGGSISTGSGVSLTMQSNFGSGYFGTTAVASANADANGHGAMEYAVPSGYYTLNTKNIKEFG
jgi:hypothetical protein